MACAAIEISWIGIVLALRPCLYVRLRFWNLSVQLLQFFPSCAEILGGSIEVISRDPVGLSKRTLRFLDVWNSHKVAKCFISLCWLRINNFQDLCASKNLCFGARRGSDHFRFGSC